MSEEWDKVKEDWKSFDEYDLKHIWAAGDTLQAETKVLKYENKQFIDRNKYLEGLTDGDVKLITGLQVENKQLQERNIDLYVHTARLDFELDQNKQKLEAIRGIIKIPEVWTHPDPIQAIREVLDKSAQNTEAKRA